MHDYLYHTWRRRQRGDAYYLQVGGRGGRDIEKPTEGVAVFPDRADDRPRTANEAYLVNSAFVIPDAPPPLPEGAHTYPAETYSDTVRQEAYYRYVGGRGGGADIVTPAVGESLYPSRVDARPRTANEAYSINSTFVIPDAAADELRVRELPIFARGRTRTANDAYITLDTYAFNRRDVEPIQGLRAIEYPDIAYEKMRAGSEAYWRDNNREMIADAVDLPDGALALPPETYGDTRRQEAYYRYVGGRGGGADIVDSPVEQRPLIYPHIAYAKMRAASEAYWRNGEFVIPDPILVPLELQVQLFPDKAPVPKWLTNEAYYRYATFKSGGEDQPQPPTTFRTTYPNIAYPKPFARYLAYIFENLENQLRHPDAVILPEQTTSYMPSEAYAKPYARYSAYIFENLENQLKHPDAVVGTEQSSSLMPSTAYERQRAAAAAYWMMGVLEDIYSTASDFIPEHLTTLHVGS